MCAEGMVGGFFSHVMIRASELFAKTCCQLWEDSDTPLVLKESDLHFRSEQNRQRINTLIIQCQLKWAQPTMQGMAATYHQQNFTC